MGRTDEKTDEMRLQLLLDWKKAYSEALIDALKPSGNVLEIGFGLGDAANRIQSHRPKHHTIIESDAELVLEARTWARKYPNVTIIHGTWQKELPKLGKFDAIFFTDHSREGELQTLRYLSPQDLSKATEKAKELVDRIEEELSGLDVNFTDKEIDEFYQKVGKKNLDKLPRFFNKLKERGHISEKQHTAIIKKYHLEKEKGLPKAVESKREPDMMFSCLEECIKNHMGKGSRFSGYLHDHVSKYEDSHFFEKIVTNPNFNYQEQLVALKLPKGKDRVNLPEALVMVIEKLA